jgi:Matrixin
MKRLDLLVTCTLAALAAFVGSQVLETRQLHAARTQNGEPVVSDSGEAADEARDEVTARSYRYSPEAEDARRRIELASTSTFIGEVLLAHDSSLARWAERRSDPLRIWIQPMARIEHWSPVLLPLVRDAFLEWGESGIPINFTFVLDSASANVHVTWVDRFREPISGKTLWTHDENWYILQANVMLAVHHQGGEPLDRAATKAIALHEVGHMLGLDHTRDTTSIMAPRVRVKELSGADRATAQLLYSLTPGKLGGRR